jgi:hypothetical protein
MSKEIVSCTRNFLFFVFFGIIVCTHPLKAGTAAYPLYFIDLADENAPEYSSADIDLLAQNFLFGHFGHRGRKSDAFNSFHKSNPNFIALKYVSTQRADEVGKGPVYAEHHRLSLLYYRCAKLSEPVTAEMTELKMEEVDGPIALKASTLQTDFSDSDDPSHKYVIWIRINNELMRVDDWNPEKKMVRVKRGFDHTEAKNYSSGADVLAPVITPTGSKKSKLQTFSPRYSFDPATTARWEVSLEKALENVKSGFDGTWYDLVSATPFEMGDLEGTPLKNVWDCVRHQNYKPDDYRLACEMGLNYVMKGYFSKMGKWPIIFINNMNRNCYYPGTGTIQNYLKSTAEKSRPVDGYCVEGFAGTIKEEDFQQWVKTGKTSPVNFVAEDKWKENVSVLMDAAQQGLAADPFMMMAAQKNRMYEHLDREFKDKFESWAYASFLMAVERKDGKCPTVYGINPFYWEGEKRVVFLHPRYTWDLGDPVESHKPDELNAYKRPEHLTYIRKFQKGIVLVNPSDKKDENVSLDNEYIDPETDQKVSSISMTSQSGKILLKE